MLRAWNRFLMAGALVACAHSSKPAAAPSEDAYPKAYVGAPANPLESALAFVHRTVANAREHHEVILLACLRDKESKLESLSAERASMTPADVDAKALRLQSEAERCIGGD